MLLPHDQEYWWTELNSDNFGATFPRIKGSLRFGVFNETNQNLSSGVEQYFIVMTDVRSNSGGKSAQNEHSLHRKSVSFYFYVYGVNFIQTKERGT